MQLRYFFALGFMAWTLAGAALSASAQSIYVPPYVRWQAAWDRGQFDRAHVILGHGTAILPTGETPSTNQRVAVVGYYSNGTFIADRVILRD
jgi:hypothetical protein